MATLIFDIKTIAYEQSDEGDNGHDQAYSPFTARVYSLALYDRERGQGVVYLSSEATLPLEYGGCLVKRAQEEDMLRDFWEGIHGYDTLVSYNGRAFDIPFLAIRSAVYRIPVTTEVVTHRYLGKQGIPRHVDIMDQLTFYGTMRKPPSLAVAAKTFGTAIPLPHDSGAVGEFSVEEVLAIHTSELHATAALYEHWLHYLAPPTFLNTIEI